MESSKTLRLDPQPALIAPMGDGYMPLYCAAQWIATAGHAVLWDVVDDEVWQAAYRLLCEAISSEEVKIVGEREGEKRHVPAFLFVNCEMSHHANLSIPDAGEFYLSSCPYIDEVRWNDGLDDSMIGRGGRPNWARLMVRKADVCRIWPFKDRQESIRTTRTGTRGRPTSKVILLREHLARWDSGNALFAIRDESLALWEWLRSRHPDAALPLPKSIEDIIREQHQAQKSKTGK